MAASSGSAFGREKFQRAYYSRGFAKTRKANEKQTKSKRSPGLLCNWFAIALQLVCFCFAIALLSQMAKQTPFAFVCFCTKIANAVCFCFAFRSLKAKANRVCFRWAGSQMVAGSGLRSREAAAWMLPAARSIRCVTPDRQIERAPVSDANSCGRSTGPGERFFGEFCTNGRRGYRESGTEYRPFETRSCRLRGSIRYTRRS